jgi:hypothetical protein
VTGRRLDAALWYARAGWAVVACKPGDKVPMIGRGWQLRATTDAAQIRAWWAETPDANVGLKCGPAFDVVDIEGPAVAVLSEWLARTGRTLPEGPLAWTGRAGFHLYCAPSGRRKADLRLGDVRLGELRTGNHLVIAPPSVTVGAYRWVMLPTTELPELPAWIDDLLPVLPKPAPILAVTQLPPDVGLAKLDALARRVARSTEGERNAILFWAARKAAAERHPESIAARVLLRAAEAVGLAEHEAVATIRSGWGWGAAQ